MNTERRRSERHAINRLAHFHTNMGSLPRECLVTDISDRGARLHSEDSVPDEFTLSLLADRSEIRHECRVVWRLGLELGVEFTDLPAR